MKKKMIHILFCIFCLIIISSNVYASNKKMLGDINKDNTIDSRDQLLIMRHIMASARKTHSEWILSGDSFKLADVTQNGRVDNSDMLRILRYIAAKRNPERIGNKHKEWLEIGEIDLNPDIEVSSIKLNKTTISLDMSGTKMAILTSTIKPDNATNKSITYSTSNEKVATVDQNGKVTAKGNGTATIKAETVNGKTATCIVTVITSETALKLNKTELSLDMSGTKTETLIATITPSTATDKSVTYTSSNTKVATVDQNGKITAKGNGTATITAKTVNGKIATCKVTVTTSPTSISLSKTSATIDLSTSKKLTLKATVNPNTASNKTITWSTSNNSIATVSNGNVTLKKAGTVNITAKTVNGKTSTCKIIVKEEKITAGEAIAEAAVQLACTAYPENPITADAGRRIYNNKTKKYVLARESLLPGCHEYASCDVGAATAIRYSNVDKNYPWNTVPVQRQYMLNSKNWKRVGTFNGTSTSNLQPGDVLIGGHIMIYTGNTIVRKRFKNSSANLYEASRNRFYPRLTLTTTRIGRQECGVYRHVNSNKKLYNKIIK